MRDSFSTGRPRFADPNSAGQAPVACVKISEMHLRGELKVAYGQASEAGDKPVNEDAIGIRIPEEAMLATKGLAAVIADGVTSAEAGREASEVCVLGFLNDYYSTPETWEVKTSARRVLAALNRWLYSEGRRFVAEHKGFISAISVLVVKSHTAHLFHVGDTRIYHLRNGDLQQLTRDHSTQVSRDTTYLSRAMGLELNLEIDYRAVPLERGDILFLSTDGVHDFVSPPDIVDAIRNAREAPDAACAALVAKALANGSADNLSCQVLAVEQLPAVSMKDACRELQRLPFPPDLEPGMILDGYRVLELLDASPRSQLYLVEDDESGARAVMKTPSVNYEDDPGYIERFILEEWIGRRVASPNLVKMLPRKSGPKFLYHLMEHVDGKPLSQWIAENPHPEIRRVVAIVEQIVKGLRALHRKETLHQDLKPDNIIVLADDSVKIIDFGSAHIAGISEIETAFEREHRLGTLPYSAPEYRLGVKPSPRSDLFSLALITYEMLTGQRPFSEKFQKARTWRDFSLVEYTPAARHNALIPPWIDGAIAKALSTNPERRQSTFSEFLTDLRKPNPRFLTAVEAAPFIEKNPVLFWKISAGVLLVALIIVLFLWASS